MDRPMLEPHLVGATLCHGVKERWLRTMTALTATPNLDWFIRELAADLAAKHAGPKLHTQLDLMVAKTPAGAKGVMFHPYLSPAGERSPFVQPAARGSFTGLSLEHTRAHLLRAVYEGVAFAMRDCYQHMPVAPKSIVLSGDVSSSPVWCQILADCLGQTVSVPAGSAFGAKGAAINVGVATGFYPSVRDGVKQSVHLRRHYRPKPPRAGRYAELYPIFRETAARQSELWDHKARIFA
jgi:sugar (pentulose or hexulose) kinase